MTKIEAEFEAQKIASLAKNYGFRLLREPGGRLPTFHILDTDDLVDNYIRVAVIQWTGESWASIVIRKGIGGIVVKNIEEMFIIAQSPYFWEISL